MTTIDKNGLIAIVAVMAGTIVCYVLGKASGRISAYGEIDKDLIEEKRSAEDEYREARNEFDKASQTQEVENQEKEEEGK